MFLLTLALGFLSPSPTVATPLVAATTTDDTAKVMAVRAGTLHLVEGGRVIEGGGTIVIRDGVIAAVGPDSEVTIPSGAHVVDFGDYASICPGFVSANGNYGVGMPSRRTADPSVMAIDNFDLYGASTLFSVAGGVTTAYAAPARGRLISGQGAVVKLSGDDHSRRILSESACLHGAISGEARGTTGYWEPPVPATVDVGMGRSLRQLPRTTMGALLALRELLAEARTGEASGLYGPDAGAHIKSLLDSGLPWRIDAQSESELRALLNFFATEKLPLIVESGDHVAMFAEELKAIGASVVLEVDFNPGARGRDRGTGRNVAVPTFNAAHKLAEAGVPFAIATKDAVSPRHLLLMAGFASRGGLSPEQALHAVTLGPAQILGVADRVGSLSVGKDADLVVMSGAPLGGGAGSGQILATLTNGVTSFDSSARSASSSSSASAGLMSAAAASSQPASAFVVSVEELHLGNGEVLSPGEVLVRDGKVIEVGRRVSRSGATRVVRGFAAMPGMIDAMGNLGLEGARTSPGPDFKLSRIVGPGNATDRRVAKAGVTTVMMTPRGINSSGSPMLAYKPAGVDVEAMVVEDPAAVYVQWANSNRARSGASLRALLAKAQNYDKKWTEYEQAMFTWTPPEPEPKKDEDEEDEKDKDDKKESKSKSKKKKKGDEEEAPPEKDPVTGVWDGFLVFAAPVETPEDSDDDSKKKSDSEDEDKSDKDDDKDSKKKSSSKSKKSKKKDKDEPTGDPLKLSLHLDGHKVSGFLRCEVISKGAVRVEGHLNDGEVVLEGMTDAGWVDLKFKPKAGELEGSATANGETRDITAKRSAKEVKRAARAAIRREAPTERVKGMPKKPGLDAKLEPWRGVLQGHKAVMISVTREDEILECVELFEAAGVAPVLYNANEAWRVADQLRGRVAGIILTHSVLRRDPRGGLLSEVNRFAEISDAGIPVAFHSGANDGAADLPLMAAYAVANGMSPAAALKALTSGAAEMMSIEDRVGSLGPGLDADLLLLDGPPVAPSTSVLSVWVNGREVQ